MAKNLNQHIIMINNLVSIFRTTSIMTKKFCPKCGNKTLKRVAVSVNEDGNKTVHLNFRRPINIRGTRVLNFLYKTSVKNKNCDNVKVI